MGDIVLVGGAGRARRLDLLPVASGSDDDSGSDGYRNVLPGYHELRVLRDGVWYGLGFSLPPDDGHEAAVAAFRLDGDARPLPVDDVAALARPAGERLRDVLADFAPSARAWQAATSAVDPAFLATPPREQKEPSLALLQVMFVYVATTDAAPAAPRLGQLLGRLAAPARLAAAPKVGAELGRAVAAMLALAPWLRPHLPVADVIGALSEVGNARGDVELLFAASLLQLQVTK
jgi:hypothetical protein